MLLFENFNKIVPGKREIIFSCLFVVLSAVARLVIDYSEQSNYGEISYLTISLFARYGLLLVVVLTTYLYFRNSQKNTTTACRWSISLFFFDMLDLAYLEIKTILAQPEIYSSWDIAQSVMLIPYFAFVTAALAGFIYFMLLFWRKS